jgi:uncharacterized membrane protein YjfL (UPF0719 family)
MSIDLVLSALFWATFAIVISQAVAIGLMWWLGLPPRKLAVEIEDVQNTAVGASFFIVSLAAAIFISLMSTSGFTPDPSFAEGTFWIIGGLIVASLYTAILFIIAHRLMGRKESESIYDYMRRELIQEQNAALAFFLGGLSVTPFVAVVFQLI